MRPIGSHQADYCDKASAYRLSDTEELPRGRRTKHTRLSHFIVPLVSHPSTVSTYRSSSPYVIKPRPTIQICVASDKRARYSSNRTQVIPSCSQCCSPLWAGGTEIRPPSKFHTGVARKRRSSACILHLVVETPKV